MPTVNYTWYLGFLLLKGAGILLALTLLSVVVLTRKRGLVPVAVIALMAFFCAWMMALVTAVSTLAFWGVDFQPVVRAGGLIWLGLIVAFYFFSEVFPDGLLTWTGRIRVALILCVSIAAAYFVITGPFIHNRRMVDGVLAADHGWAYLFLNGWVGVMASSALALVAVRRARSRDAIRRRQLGRLLLAGICAVLVGMTFSILLPLLGIQKYFYLGTTPPFFVLLALVHAALYDHAFNVAAFALGLLLRRIAALILFSAVGIAFLLVLFDLGLASPSAGLFIWAIAAAGIASLAQALLIPRLSRMFVRELPAAELIINEILGKTGGPLSGQDGIYQSLSALLADRLWIEKALIVVASARGPAQAVSSSGEIPAIVRRIRNPLGDRRLRANAPHHQVIQFLDRIIEIDNVNAGYFPEAGRLGRRYSRFARFANHVITALKGSGYTIVLPLVFHERIGGFVAIGRRKDHRPFLPHDFGCLNAVRLTLAVVTEHVERYAEIQARRTKAESDAQRMAEILAAPVIRREELKNKTLIYGSKGMTGVMDKVSIAAPGSQPVLVLGETGTGKELIAQLIHMRGKSPNEPFVAVNCGAIPDALWEDEVFGHVQGAFTDARSDRKGRIAQAGQGTLLLDEVGEMSLGMQVKLLRVLQEREYTPVGGSRSLRAECRFVFATNRDLKNEVAAGRFREDLYYRINVFPIRIPPLRERVEDIPAIVDALLATLITEFDRPVRTMGVSAMHLLMRYPWPGNVRELENVTLRAFLSSDEPEIEPIDLPLDLPAHGAALRAKINGAQSGIYAGAVPGGQTFLMEGKLDQLLADYEKKVIEHALLTTNGNKSQAARLLGVTRSTLRYKMKGSD